MKLSILASDLVDALPKSATDVRLYISDLGMYYAGELRADQVSARPDIPYYGQAFSDALNAIERGWANRADYHRDRVAAAVKKAGGVLSEMKRVQRSLGGNPQPTDRRSLDNGRTPWTGKE